MDLNSTSFTSDGLVFRLSCDAPQRPASVFNNGWNGGILFHDYKQGLSGCKSKWLGDGHGMEWVRSKGNIKGNGWEIVRVG